MRSAAPLASMIAVLALSAVPAAASEVPSQNGCPPPFRPYTTDEQYALAADMGVPPEEVAAAIAKIDKNRDGTLCFKFFKSGGPNIIDNRSAHD